jgi:hypothetical protein
MNPPRNPKRDWHSEPELPETIEIDQPDPALQEEKAGPLGLTIFALFAIAIVGLVLYAVNRPAHEDLAARLGTSGSTASAPPQQPVPAQDEASKGGGPADKSTPATTGAAPRDGAKETPPAQSAQPAQPKADAKPDKAQ